MAPYLGTIPIPNPIANPIPNLRGLAIVAPSYGGPYPLLSCGVDLKCMPRAVCLFGYWIYDRLVYLLVFCWSVLYLVCLQCVHVIRYYTGAVAVHVSFYCICLFGDCRCKCVTFL